MRNRSLPLFAAALAVVTILAGCESQATPQSEVHAGIETKQKAQDASDEAAKQVKDGNAVLDGK